MFVQYDNSPIPPPRRHPWTIVEDDPGLRYWNFREQTEKIPVALEDFMRWAKYPAIAKFYELLAWLNGEDSVFETNDCALGEPRIDHQTPPLVRQAFDKDPVCIHGRLTVIFRDLEWNTSRPNFDHLKRMVHDNLFYNVPNYPSVIFVGEWPHLFTALDKEGHALALQFWAWGDDEALAFENLQSTFDTLLQLFKYLSEAAKADTQSVADGASQVA
jgi:hypothetical protein